MTWINETNKKDKVREDVLILVWGTEYIRRNRAICQHKMRVSIGLH